MSSALSPAMAFDIRVSASPEDRLSASTSVTSSMITPSTTHRGLEEPKIDVAPRTRIFGAVPNVPLTFCTDTPAARPSSERLISATPSSFASAALILVEAPVNNRLSMVCIPVTTTSLSVLLSSSRIILVALSEALRR